MPLDALTGSIRTETLADALADRDIRPVDWITLNAHMQTQLQKFGPSFWFRHQGALGIALIGSVGLMAVNAGAAHAVLAPTSPAPMWIASAWICLTAMVLLCGTIRVRAGSHWEERWLPADMMDELDVPRPIAEMARTLQREIPGSNLVLGELIRELVVLDPYLLLVHGEDRVCLGVWDDDGIICRAS